MSTNAQGANRETDNKVFIKDRREKQVPINLGRYRILQEVGRGATAFVYKAYDPQLDRYLAIKVLRKELAKDNDYRNAFIREAQLAAQLTHPNIVTIFDVGIADNKPYIAMELLEGPTLEQILKLEKTINLRTVLSIAIQLSSALSYAHKQGVIHRDIKPANIVILKNKKTVKLTDFGIAQLEDALGAAGKRSDKVLGTPEYMAPEQILGRPMDNRSDLYSLGVLIYQLLMGAPPFVDDDIGQLFKRIVKNKAPLIVLQKNREQEIINDDLSDLVRKLLQKQASKRFQKSSLLTNELRRIQAKLGQSIKDYKKGFISLRLRWTATMASVVFVAMCISLMVVYLVQNNALSGITFDYGRSIARMIAFESSEPILLEDYVGLNALITESSKNEQLQNVTVMDLDNQVLASTNNRLVGNAFKYPEQRELQESMDNVNIYQRELAGKKILFDIEIDIAYADKKVGRLYLTFSGESMRSASKVTLLTMLTTMMITLLVVFIITFFIARQTSKDYERLTAAFKKLAYGRLDARLISDKNDEVSQLFNAFNHLAQQLENQSEIALPAPQKFCANNIKISEKSKGTAPSVHDTVELDINIEDGSQKTKIDREIQHNEPHR